MRKMGFHERWISLVMIYISIVSYSVLINGEAKGNLIPSRALDKGIQYPHICNDKKGRDGGKHKRDFSQQGSSKNLPFVLCR